MYPPHITTSHADTSHTEADTPGVIARITRIIAMNARQIQLLTGNQNGLKTSVSRRALAEHLVPWLQCVCRSRISYQFVNAFAQFLALAKVRNF